MDFYEAIDEINPNQRNLAMTVLEGEYLGEKALFTDDRLVWTSGKPGFFQLHIQEFEKIEHGETLEVSQGILVIDGTRVFCELLGTGKKFVICGGGHVSVPIIQMGLMIGCHITVLEDRPKFADNARRAGASKVICEPFEEGLKQIKGDGDTFFIIVTRGHRYDQVCLENIARKPHAYIGMIGSRMRVKKVKEAVIEKGCAPDVVNRIYSPIGLNIRAETPEEIGIAILAEIIEVKNKEKRSFGYPKEIIHAILNKDTMQKQKVMATIIDRKGSAPRGIGTKMLVLSDGVCVGTIGGGCVEADILQKALLMIRSGEMRPQLCHIDMTGQDAEDEGMVCGGVIDVLLEPVR